eukprot:TRINITY_DN6918_c0_g1_i8.p1 TRINITY_DN6918_c0_g1~~TRINITY_DN6918_c0_g1_i8.p1  ORF type:complete len:144 (+),score=22.99 TRINITY_DN6918_c0_g1_i8:499-930(+)
MPWASRLTCFSNTALVRHQPHGSHHHQQENSYHHVLELRPFRPPARCHASAPLLLKPHVIRLRIRELRFLRRSAQIPKAPHHLLTTQLACFFVITFACHSLPLSSHSPVLCVDTLSLIHISEPTRLLSISYAVFCLKKKKKKK